MECKSDAVRRMVAYGDYQDAIRIAKGFRRGISPDDQNALRRAHECFINPQFYRSIGMDPLELIAKGVETIKRLYGPQKQ